MDRNETKRAMLFLNKLKAGLDAEEWHSYSQKYQDDCKKRLNKIAEGTHQYYAKVARELLDKVNDLPDKKQSHSMSSDTLEEAVVVRFDAGQRVKTVEQINTYIPIGTIGTIDSVLSGMLYVLFEGQSHRKLVNKSQVVLVSVPVVVSSAPDQVANDDLSPSTEEPVRVAHHYAVMGSNHPVLVDKDSPKNHQSLIHTHEGENVKNNQVGSEKDLDGKNASQTNPLNAGVGGGDDGSNFLASLSESKVKTTDTKKKQNTQKGTDFILQQLDTVIEQLASGEYWSLTSAKQKKVIVQLNQIATTEEQSQAFKDSAKTLLTDIQQRLAIAETIQSTWQVKLRVAIDGKPAGSIGTVMSVINAKAHVRFDGDKKMKAISKFLLDPVVVPTAQEPVKDVEIPSVIVEAVQDASSAVTEIPSFVEKNILPPAPVDLVQPVESESLASLEKQPVIEPLSELEYVDEIGKSDNQPPFMPTAPIKNIEDGSTVVDAAHDLMVIPQPKHQEETLPIGDPDVFVPYFLFARNELGVRQIYVVLGGKNYPESRTVSLCCQRLNQSDKTWSRKLDLRVEYHRFFKSYKMKDVFYLTSRESQMVYTQCLVGLPFKYLSVQPLLNFQNMLQDSLLDQLMQYATEHPGFSHDRDALFVFAELAKRRIQDVTVFSSIVRIIINDDPSNMGEAVGLFQTYLDDSENNSVTVQLIATVIAEKQLEIRKQQVVDEASRLACLLQDSISGENLSIVEAQIKQLKEVVKA